VQPIVSLFGEPQLEGLYRLVDAAYERRSIALSSNLHPSGFDQLMPPSLATALVDRLLHHAHVVQTSGESIRLQDATSGKGVNGDLCVRCGAPLRVARGIELGHVFQLGRKYAKVFGLEVLGPDGKPKVVTMGSYGIGVSRAVALAEQTFDDLGLCWPRSVAPADVHLVATGKGDVPFEAGELLASQLQSGGVTVLYDDQ
jgi:prolyl-tRNA synthetase